MSVLQRLTPSPTGLCGQRCLDCDVRHLSVCAPLQGEALAAMQRLVRVQRLQPGQRLVEQGAPSDRVFTVTQGMLRLQTDLADGRRQIARFLLPGDYLGLADDDIHAESAEAIGTVELCVFARRDMDRAMEIYPSLRDRLFAMTRAALRQARDSQLVLGRLAPVEKLASFLLQMRARLAEAGQPHAVLPLPMTRTDIADYLGLTVETVSRSFTKLKTQGLIRLDDTHAIAIPDLRALQAVAGTAG